MIFRRALLASLVALTPQVLLAETIRLSTGEVLMGEVRSADFEEFAIDVTFPSERSLVLSTDELAPETVYSVLSTRLPANEAATRMELAEYCLRSGLYAHAVVEARRAAELDATQETRTEEIESSAWEAIARSLLDEAKTHIAIEEPGTARLYLMSVLDRYPTAKAATEAKRLLDALPPDDTPINRVVVTEPEAKDDLRAKLSEAQRLLQKADNHTDAMRRHFQIGKSDEHLLRRAETYYRKAYGLLRTAANKETDDDVLNEQIRTLASTGRQRLCKAYLELGSLYLARGSIKLAEDYCQRACQVEPENQELHGLHQRIIDARIALRFGI